MASNVWSGHLTFGLVSLPVRLVVAARPESVGFNQLHRDCGSRLEQRMFCKTHGTEVPQGEVVKGFEYDKGRYVVIEDEDLEKAAPETTASMEILEFVKSGNIDPLFLENSYYLRPDEAGERAYALLYRALKETKHVGVAKVSMRKREHIVIVRPGEHGLLLHTMFYADEIRELDEFRTDESAVADSELKLAKALIKELAGDFEPEKYSDTYRANLREAIKAKLEGKTQEGAVIVRHPGAPVIDIQDALRKSLKSAKTPAAAEKKQLA